MCYNRPIRHAQPHPGLNTIPNHCARKHSLQLSGSGMSLPSGCFSVESGPILVFLLLICFFITGFVRKIVVFYDKYSQRKPHIPLSLPIFVSPTVMWESSLWFEKKKKILSGVPVKRNPRKA